MHLVCRWLGQHAHGPSNGICVRIQFREKRRIRYNLLVIDVMWLLLLLCSFQSDKLQDDSDQYHSITLWLLFVCFVSQSWIINREQRCCKRGTDWIKVKWNEFKHGSHSDRTVLQPIYSKIVNFIHRFAVKVRVYLSFFFLKSSWII